MNLTTIGFAHTPYDNQQGTPIQPNMAESREAEIEILPQYREGLNDLGEFERIWVISWLDQSTDFKLKVIPYRDTVERGLFATRAPRRPNPIGLSLVKVTGVDVEQGLIKIDGIDLLNGTPILDIKPYVPKFEGQPDSKAGWLDRGNDTETADERFDTGR